MENKSFELKIIESGDGSHTLFHEGLNETYHSTHGAIQESEHVFIKEGLLPFLKKGLKRISIFEVGFGTGLNAWLTFKSILDSDVKIIYHAVEPFPVEESIYKKLNYTETESGKDNESMFLKLHQAPWNIEVELHPKFNLKKINQKFEDYSIVENSMDIIFYDAFAPSKQAEMWVPENIAKTYLLLNKNGVLVTYCAKGQFKRDCKAAGFQLETLEGPPGKKEMTRAVK